MNSFKTPQTWTPLHTPNSVSLDKSPRSPSKTDINAENFDI